MERFNDFIKVNKGTISYSNLIRSKMLCVVIAVVQNLSRLSILFIAV